MLSSKWNRWLLVGGAAVGALAVGCAEEDPGSPPPQTGLDSGIVGGTDGGLDSAAPSTCTSLGGAQCTLADGGFGFQLCTNGVPSGPCSPISKLIPDGGFGDSGLA